MAREKRKRKEKKVGGYLCSVFDRRLVRHGRVSSVVPPHRHLPMWVKGGSDAGQVTWE